MSSLSASDQQVGEARVSVARRDMPGANAATGPMRMLIVAPTLDGGAADAGAIELTRILSAAGHQAIVVSRAGRLVPDVTAAGGEFIDGLPYNAAAPGGRDR